MGSSEDLEPRQHSLQSLVRAWLSEGAAPVILRVPPPGLTVIGSIWSRDHSSQGGGLGTGLYVLILHLVGEVIPKKEMEALLPKEGEPKLSSQ